MRGYVARDRNGLVYFFDTKPIKGQAVWTGDKQCLVCRQIETLPDDINPQWVDEEPIEVEISITKVKK